MKEGVTGLPDGLKIDKQGNVFASGPGGVYIFNTAAKLMGLVQLREPASNVALSPDEKTLYITNNMQVLRLRMRK
jgi:gluconolactonase